MNKPKAKITDPPRESRSLIPVMTASCILIIAALIAFMLFNGSVIRKNNREYFVNDTKQSAQNLERSLAEGMNNIRILSRLVSDSLTSPEINIADYQELIQHTTFDFMEFADRAGWDHNITGGTSDARDRQYYRNAMQGNTGVEAIFNSRATHENLLMFYSPVTYQDEIVGSLIGVYQASNRITELMKLDYFGESVTAYLCSRTGRIFASSVPLDAAQELLVKDVLRVDEKNAAIVRDALLRGQAASFQPEDRMSGGYIQPLANSEWMLVQLYPSAVNMRMIGKSNAIGIALVAALLAILVSMQVIVYRRHKAQQNKLVEAYRQLRQIREEESQQLRILQSMAGIYYSMHLVDLTNNCATEYVAQNHVKDIVGNTLVADKTMHAIMHATMSDAYLETGLAFTELTTLPERMRNKKVIFKDLLGRNVGWIRLSFITIEADEAGIPQKVLVSTQIIDEEKKREEKLLLESGTDKLTGCLNRRSYEAYLAKDTDTSENLVYIAMDINGLKTVNDSLGHEAGDELISGAVQCMHRCLGSFGNIYRIGGDEFAAVIYCDSRALSDIMQDFEEVQNNWSGNHVSSVSVSWGCAARQEFPEMSVRELANVADRRMYENKAAYYRTKGVDRRGQSAAHAALCALYTKILKVNLTEDSYQIITMDPGEQSAAKGFTSSISGWLTGFGSSEQVHPEDREEFLRKTDLAYLRDSFRSGKTSVGFSYRRKIKDIYTYVVMELTPAREYTDDNQILFLFIKPTDRQ